MKHFIPLPVSVIAMIFMVAGAEAESFPLAPPVPASASPAKRAYEAFGEGYDTFAVQLAEPLAAAGDLDALFLRGVALEPPAVQKRQSPKTSLFQAASYYYRQAAQAGHKEAGLRDRLMRMNLVKGAERAAIVQELETLARAGDPVAFRIIGEAWIRGFVEDAANADKAEEYWKKAAEKGDAVSWMLLGKLHDGTLGVPGKMDVQASLDCYRKAQSLNDDGAWIALGALLLRSDHPFHDEKAGYESLEKAVEKGRFGACLVLGTYEENVKHNKNVAMNHYLKGAEGGEPECMSRLAGMLTAAGKAKEGWQWLEKSANAGNPKAAADFGRHLLNDSPSDVSKAARYLLAAADADVWQAQYDLALIYLDGKLGEPDPHSAVAWLTEAMQDGDAQVRYKLATLHEQGIGTPVNYANAGVLYDLAARKNHPGALARIAYMVSEGLGTRRDPATAWAYATRASELGDLSVAGLLKQLDAGMSVAEKEKANQEIAKLRPDEKDQKSGN